MFILMHCGGMAFNAETVAAGKSLGGSESAAYFMARELAALGHQVSVYTGLQAAPTMTSGVRYRWAGHASERFPLGHVWHHDIAQPHDVCIVQRHPLAFAHAPNSKLNFWWLHDLALIRSAGMVQRHMPHIDRVITVSEFHRRQVAQIYGLAPEHVVASRNGVDYAMFADINERRDRKAMIFASRPERGLGELVDEGGIMDLLPDAHLFVAGYDNTTAPMAEYYAHLRACCERRHNVTWLGALGKSALYRLLARGALYVYPTTFEDTSNIMLLEANAAGTPFVGCRTGALPETADGGGAVLVPLSEDGAVDRKGFADTIKSLLGNDVAWQKLHNAAIEKDQSWAAVAVEWSLMFEDLLAAKSAEPYRLARHLERMSDICALRRKFGHDDIVTLLPDFDRNYRFLIDGDFASHYAAYYDYEAERGVVYGPEDLAGNPRFEAVAKIVAGDIKLDSVLDYGCAHGHYVMNLLARLPHVHFTGIDISQRNIDAARKWATDAVVENGTRMPSFVCGDDGDLPEDARFDVILLGEVLEHVEFPTALVENLKRHLSERGRMVITTPYGPWEAIGYSEHKGWRAHIHHFERADLLEMFGGQPGYQLMAVPHSKDLGSFVTTFRAGGPEVGGIDYARKLRQQAPRETLSVCLIVKDGEHTLGRCLQSVAAIADEIIVGIDKTTTDNTRRVAEQFGAQCIDIESPIKTGFDEARNATIARASMDWILWLDDDETLEHGAHLAAYLRANALNGYAIQQHHFSVEPAGKLRTDLPVRLFRNRLGIRFFGFVHEHPEIELNKGLGTVVLLPDVHIMHGAYSTEDVRRRRFARNWPLMQRDREKYPARTLGRFLWMRDLSHTIRYHQERTGGACGPEQIAAAEEIVRLWRDLLAQGETRFVLEGLPYYSHAAEALGSGLHCACQIGADVGRRPNMPKQRMDGVFVGVDDFKALTAHLADVGTRTFVEKYF